MSSSQSDSLADITGGCVFFSNVLYSTYVYKYCTNVTIINKYNIMSTFKTLIDIF